MDGLVIREQQLGDEAAVRRVVAAAFGRNDEADLVEQLRDHDCHVLSLVAVRGSTLIGHILFSRCDLRVGERVMDACALAPLSVDPGYQRRGVGSALTKTGLAKLAQRGGSAFVFGDPNYYQRFGFSIELAARVESPYQGPHLLAIELSPGALEQGGLLIYPAPFQGGSESPPPRS